MSKLRKIGRILLLVGGILSLVGSMCFSFLLALACFVVPTVLKSVGVLQDPIATGVIIGGIAGGVVFLFDAIFSLVAGVLGIKGFKQHEKNIYVGNIVFGVLTGFQLLLIAGAILGLIALRRERKALEPEAEEEAE